MRGWLRRQGARAAWLSRDLRMIADGVRRAARGSCIPDQPTLALLAGSPWALVGAVNGYRVRVANPIDATCAVELVCTGEAPGRGQTSARRVLTLAPETAVDVWLRTDWVAEFGFVDAEPVLEPERYLRVPTLVGMCRLDAELRAMDAAVAALVMGQPLAR